MREREREREREGGLIIKAMFPLKIKPSRSKSARGTLAKGIKLRLNACEGLSTQIKFVARSFRASTSFKGAPILLLQILINWNYGIRGHFSSV